MILKVKQSFSYCNFTQFIVKAKRLLYLVNASAVRRPRQQKTCTNRSNYRSFVHKVTLLLFVLFRLRHQVGGLYRLQISYDVLLLGPVKSEKLSGCCQLRHLSNFLEEFCPLILPARHLPCQAFSIHSSGMPSMAFPVVEFSREGYKIRKVFG